VNFCALTVAFHPKLFRCCTVAANIGRKRDWTIPNGAEIANTIQKRIGGREQADPGVD
jgi:hypothetical protein